MQVFKKKRNKEISVLQIVYGLYYWKRADRIEVGFSLNNRPKQAENKSD